jgi:hypothetical protein
VALDLIVILIVVLDLEIRWKYRTEREREKKKKKLLSSTREGRRGVAQARASPIILEVSNEISN